MKKLFIFTISCMLLYSVSFSQGIIRGTITDENGETLIGATIIIKSQPSIGAVSDFNGQYSLKITGSDPQIIAVSYVSYKTLEDTVNPLNGEVVIRDFSMTSASVVMEAAVVVGKAKKSKDIYMEKVQIKSAVSLNYISAETIKKIGDTNVSSAVARVSGVSTNGSFITVRGIGDRYMKTAINGLRIPTLDPFTNNIKLDMFPASLVDNIILVKTASPDLPGDWAGAYLSVETKDYPENLSINVETSFGYNQQSSFKEVVSTQRSSTDWLGYDNGMRDIDHSEFVSVYPAPTTFQEFVALGLGDFYKSLGVTQNSWKNDGSAISNVYTKLGLAELGFLDKNKFNDPVAYSEALNSYNSSSYKQQAFDIINSPGIKAQNKLFPDNWNTTTHKAPLNYSQSVSIGNQTSLFGKPLGFIAGFRYSSSLQNDPDFTSHRFYRELESGGVGSNNWYIGNDTTIQKASKETNGLSALLNLAYKYSPNHSISLLFMPNLTGVSTVKDGYVYNSLINDLPFNKEYNRRQEKFYEERKQFVYQVKSEHYIPLIRLKMELNTSYTNGYSKVPNFMYVRPGDPNDDRFFRYLNENVFDSRFAAELPVGKTTEAGTMKFKFGAAYQFNSRKGDQYDYMFMGNTGGYSNHTVDASLHRFYEEYGRASNHSVGNSKIEALFVMLDYPISPSVRFSGGVRAEHANIFADIALYDSLLLPTDDLRRVEIQMPLNPGSLDKISYLPSGNLIVKIKRDEQAPINLRLNFSQTVARPSIREVSSFSVYDNELKSNVMGNPNLKMVQINNYDLRFEAFFSSGDNVSISAFRKDFKNHIEFFNFGPGFDGVGMRWQNSPFNSYLNGIELEGKKDIMDHLELRVNATLVKSRSKMDLSYYNELGDFIPGEIVTHTMLGQAPYIVNGMVSYNSDKSGFTATLSYNRQGPRLVIVGMYGDPNIYEMPRNLLDFKASKSIGKHFNISIKVQDILNSSVQRSYNFGDNFHLRGYLLDYDKYTWGTSYIFAIAYKL